MQNRPYKLFYIQGVPKWGGGEAKWENSHIIPLREILRDYLGFFSKWRFILGPLEHFFLVSSQEANSWLPNFLVIFNW